MVRKRRRGGERTPVDQLHRWRDWRHDTAEFPVVPAADAHPQRDYPEQDEVFDGAYDGADTSAGTPRARRRPGAGVLIGAALVVLVLALGGLSAAGVGPVRDLLGAGTSGGGSGSPASTSRSTGTDAGSAGSGSSSGSTPSRSAPSSAAPSQVPSQQAPSGPGAAPKNGQGDAPKNGPGKAPRNGPGNGAARPSGAPSGAPAGGPSGGPGAGGGPAAPSGAPQPPGAAPTA